MAQKEAVTQGTKTAQQKGPSETLTQQAFPETPNAPYVVGAGPWVAAHCAVGEMRKR